MRLRLIAACLLLVQPAIAAETCITPRAVLDVVSSVMTAHRQVAKWTYRLDPSSGNGLLTIAVIGAEDRPIIVPFVRGCAVREAAPEPPKAFGPPKIHL